jgi:hypothetical protein
MPNMSYCRFENTANDLKDCYDNWESLDRLDADEIPNGDEIKARKRLLRICKEIVATFGDD